MDRESDRGGSEAGSGRGTPRSLDQENLRCDTPGTMPTYTYSADELYELEKSAVSQVIPDCLEKDFIVEGIWEPERWVKSFGGGGGGSASESRGGSRGPSPLAVDNPRERRGAEMFRRNSGSERSADPKERLKEEKDGIVLSPQRRSFGTGCHVTQQPLLQRALSNLEADRERRDQRRIGSGRIQIDRDRGGRERTESDFRSERNERHHEKDPRDFRNVREIDRDRDRDRDRDFHTSRDRFDRDDRRFGGERVFTRRDMGERVDRHRESRDFRDFRNHRRDRHDSHREDEPEWFSSGPLSKNDTIELHGFERERRDSDRRRSEGDHVTTEAEKRVIDRREEPDEREGSDDEKENEGEGISVADRNGSLETNESSSPENNHSDMDVRPSKSPSTHLPSFDFNEFFNIDNIPGLSVPDEIPDTDMANIGGSRFYQLYRNTAAAAANQQGKAGSRENSRRSSLIEDEFGYLNDLVNGSRSPVIPSPPPPSANSVCDRSSFLSPFATSDKQHHLEFGTVGQKFGVLNNNTLVTALINNAAVMERNRSSPTGMKSSPQETEARLKALLFGSRLDSTSSSGNTTPGFNSPMNVPGKVKTVAELEDELQKAHKTRRGSTPPAMVVHRGSPQGGVVRRGSPQGNSNDLTAFNKLITLMQQGAARPVESPKIPMKVDARPPSPLTSIPAHLQPAHIQQAPHSQQIPVSHQHPAVNQQRPVMPTLQQTTPTLQQATPTQIQGLPPQHQQQGRMIHKPEPLNIHGQMLQNQRGSMDEIQFDMMDGYSVNMTTPTSGAPPTKFLEALQRNKEQQLQIRQATIHNMRLQHQHMSTPGHASQPQMVTSGQPGHASQPQMVTSGQPGHVSQPQMVTSGHVSQPQIVPPIQQQTPNQPAQQQSTGQGRRSSTGDPIMSFLKANPTIITKPASPTPPPQQTPTAVPVMNFVQQIQPGTSPRGPSPSPVLQSALLSRQAPGTPRVPSPIMFSQQPPMHLSAPSPIHPVQGGSLSQSPVGQPGSSTSANSIRPPAVPRVPSPQELIVHTQAILQNALIKKQLEDQKERFYKKQQERVKSPNPTSLGGKPIDMSIMNTVLQQAGMSMPPAPITSTPAKPTPVNVAFTPTSVIRKMHSEKASEKEKLRRDSMDTDSLEAPEDQVEGSDPTSNGQLQPSPSSRLDHLHLLNHQQQQQLQSSSSSTPLHTAPPTSIPPPSVIHGVPPPPLPNQVLPNMVSVLPPGAMIPGLPPFNTNQLKHLPPPPPLVSTHLPPPLLSPGGVLAPPPHAQNPTLVTQEQIEAMKSQQLRALMGQQSPNAQNLGMAVVTSTLPTSGRPIVKGNVVSLPHTPGTPTSITTDISMRPPMGTSTPAANSTDLAKLLQRQQLSTSPHVVPRPQGTPTSPYGIPIAGRLPLPNSGSNPVLVQQMVPGANPRGLGQYPQLASLHGQPRMLDPRALRGQLPQGIVPASLANQPFNPRTFNPQMNPQKNGPVSPGHIPVSMVTVSNSNKPDSVNLMKWFGTDMLKTSLPTMPPLPVQGQRVLTLDEIERL